MKTTFRKLTVLTAGLLLAVVCYGPDEAPAVMDDSVLVGTETDGASLTMTDDTTMLAFIAPTYNQLSVAGWITLFGKAANDSRTITLPDQDCFTIEDTRIEVKYRPVVTANADGTWTITFVSPDASAEPSAPDTITDALRAINEATAAQDRRTMQEYDVSMRTPDVEWIGCPMVSDDAPYTPSQAWLPTVEIGLREDGVVVWRKRESTKP